jgi:tRNA (guanine9-N1)-methyltransferase
MENSSTIENKKKTFLENNENPRDESQDSTENEKSADADDKPKTMSKNQQKKLARLERQMKHRVEKRKREREQRKLKHKNNKAVIENDQGERVEVTRKSLKKNLMSLSTSKLRLVVDCSFENLMNDGDIRHLVKQLGYCYASNRRIKNCLQFYLTSMNGMTKELLDKSGLACWDVHKHEKFYIDVFENEPKENICYLTSDSPNELNEFDESKIYIIGGFVDHNHHKSLCYNMAVEKGIMHYRLPINKFMHMKTRPVLTVNQVFEIICRYTECKNWKQAFISVLPKRKGAEIKQDEDEKEREEQQKESPKNAADENNSSQESEAKKKKLDVQY